ncbi:hypothetical protein ATCC90586_011263 [Pythium insidiosum]|nr:hypothetical protein ATCC90586_011263 [Pythium insidiosum]
MWEIWSRFADCFRLAFGAGSPINDPPFESPWASAPRVLPKKSGEKRMVVNHRGTADGPLDVLDMLLQRCEEFGPPRENKLAVTLLGPKRIVPAITDYIYELQDVIEPFAVTTRLRCYREGLRGVTEDIVAHALHTDGGYLVNKLNVRLSAALLQDVPQLVKSFVETSTDTTVQRMWTDLQGQTTASKA